MNAMRTLHVTFKSKACSDHVIGYHLYSSLHFSIIHSIFQPLLKEFIQWCSLKITACSYSEGKACVTGKCVGC